MKLPQKVSNYRKCQTIELIQYHTFITFNNFCYQFIENIANLGLKNDNRKTNFITEKMVVNINYYSKKNSTACFN